MGFNSGFKALMEVWCCFKRIFFYYYYHTIQFGRWSQVLRENILPQCSV